MEKVDVQQLRFCGRAVELLGMGRIHIVNVEHKPRYQIHNRGTVIYQFTELDKLEIFLEKCVRHRTSYSPPAKRKRCLVPKSTFAYSA